MTTAFVIGCVVSLLVGLGLGRELKWACCECDRREAREQAEHIGPAPRLAELMGADATTYRQN